MKRIRAFFLAFIVLSIAVLAVLVALHYRTRKGIEVTITEDKGVGLKVNDIHYSRTKDGRVEWVLDAESATGYKSAEEMVLEAVRLVFYARDGRPYRLYADTGTVDQGTGEVTAQGAVRVESMDGSYRLTTDKMLYQSENKVITTKSPVRITTTSMDVTGVGMRVELDSGRLFIDSDVRAVLKDGAVNGSGEG